MADSNAALKYIQEAHLKPVDDAPKALFIVKRNDPELAAMTRIALRSINAAMDRKAHRMDMEARRNTVYSYDIYGYQQASAGRMKHGR